MYTHKFLNQLQDIAGVSRCVYSCMCVRDNLSSLIQSTTIFEHLLSARHCVRCLGCERTANARPEVPGLMELDSSREALGRQTIKHKYKKK